MHKPCLTSRSLDLRRSALRSLLAYHTVPMSASSTYLYPCLCMTYRPVVCPAADFEAVLAFSAFFTLCAAARFSLPSFVACERAAARASGLMERRSLITSSEAPTTARWLLTWRRRRDLAASCT